MKHKIDHAESLDFSEHNASIRDLHKTLLLLGYIELKALSEMPVDHLTPHLIDALDEYGRRWLGLEQKLDIKNQAGIKVIIAAIQQRFCGVPDINSEYIHVSAYGSPRGRWNRGNLTYSVNSAGSNLSLSVINGVMANAFQQWQSAAPFFTFMQVNANADIKIQFGGANLDARFGKSGGVAGVGNYPEDGRLFFDAAEIWTASSLLSVALHEIGHVLGLSHSTSRSSLMYPYDMNFSNIDNETIQAIQGIYNWQPQRSFDDRGSSDGPALAVGGTVTFTSSEYRLYMAWKGIEGDSSIYWSSFDGNSWTSQEMIEGIGSSHGPALSSYYVTSSDSRPFTGLFMAWKGVRDDNNIYFAQNRDLLGWSGQRRIEGVGTSDRPALAYFNGRMYIAWKGVPGDSGIYWSFFDGNNWSPQQNIRGRGTATSPALATFNNKLYMFWRGIEDDDRLFYAWIDDQPASIWEAQREVVYTNAETSGNVFVNTASSNHPTAVARGNSIMLAWKGIPGDSSLWFSPFDALNNEWSGQIRINGAGTSSGPSITEFNGRLYLAWKGIGGDSNLYYSWLG